MKLKNLFAAMIAVPTLFFAHASCADEQTEKPHVVTIVTAPEPQTQLMAMVLTMQSIQAGSTAQILLCGPAADIALKDAPQSATQPQKPKGMSPKGLMQIIMEKTKTKVEVCAIYLPNKELDKDALIPGVGSAKPDFMAKEIIAKNTRILSF